MSNLRSIGQAFQAAALADSIAAVQKKPRNLAALVAASGEALAGVRTSPRKVHVGNAKLKLEKIEFRLSKRRNGTKQRLMKFGSNPECALDEVDWLSVLAVCQGKLTKTMFRGCYSVGLDVGAGLLRIRCSTTSTYGEIASSAVCKLA